MFLCAKHGKHILSHPYLPPATMIAILCAQSIPLVCFREPFMWLVWDRPLLTVPLSQREDPDAIYGTVDDDVYATVGDTGQSYYSMVCLCLHVCACRHSRFRA